MASKQYYIDRIKLMLTGNLTHIEIKDETIGQYVDLALEEIARYIDETTMITVPYASCIDLTDFKHSSITNVYRAEGYTGDTTQGYSTSEVDPLYAQTWSVFTSGGTMYNLNNYVMNFMSYNTLLQMRNTLSTPLDFKEDKHNNKLYITSSYEVGYKITIEYVPIFKNVEDVKSDYWIDIIRRMSLAMVKIALGRIRTRYTQNNAQWAQDGDKLLEEGNTELKELREVLRINSTYFYVGD